MNHQGAEGKSSVGRAGSHPDRSPTEGAESSAGEVQSKDRLDAVRTRSARRVLVVIAYLLLAGAIALAWLDLDGPASAWAPAVFLLGLGITFVLRRAIRNIPDAPDSALDERLVALRNAAHRTAYIVIYWATVSAVLGLLLLNDVEARQLEALFWGFALGATLTPIAIVAWREPEV